MRFLLLVLLLNFNYLISRDYYINIKTEIQLKVPMRQGELRLDLYSINGNMLEYISTIQFDTSHKNIIKIKTIPIPDTTFFKAHILKYHCNVDFSFNEYCSYDIIMDSTFITKRNNDTIYADCFIVLDQQKKKELLLHKAIKSEYFRYPSLEFPQDDSKNKEKRLLIKGGFKSAIVSSYTKSGKNNFERVTQSIFYFDSLGRVIKDSIAQHFPSYSCSYFYDSNDTIFKKEEKLFGIPLKRYYNILNTDGYRTKLWLKKSHNLADTTMNITRRQYFDKDNKLILDENFNNERTPKIYYQYREGLLVLKYGEKEYANNIKLNLKYQHFEYDSNQNLIYHIKSNSEYNSKSAIYKEYEYYTSFVYDSSNRIIEKNEIQDFEDTLSKIVYQYNSYGLLEKETFYEPNIKVEENTYEYDDYGNMIKKINYNNMFEKSIVISYKYNKNNQIIEKKGSFPANHYFKYDEYGNIIEDIRYIDGKLTEKTTYEYFKE